MTRSRARRVDDPGRADSGASAVADAPPARRLWRRARAACATRPAGLWRAATLAVVALVVAAGTSAPLASAQGSDGTVAADPLLQQVSDAVAAHGWYTEPGAGMRSATAEGLARRLEAAGAPWGLVALARPPDGGTRFFAADLLDAVRGGGDSGADAASAGGGIATVIVLTPSDVAGESRTYPADRLDAALVDAIPTFDRDVVGGYERVFQTLSGAPLTTRAARPAGSRRGGKLPMVVAGVALVAAVAALVVVRGAAHRE